MQQILAGLAQWSTIVFAVSTMFGLGLGEVLTEVVARLKNWRFDIGVLAVNFIVVPAAALILAEVFALSVDVRVGLLLVACAAGAPVVAKLTQTAKGDSASSIALVTLLIVATVGFMPLALPTLLPGVTVNVGAIAIALSWQMLLPLAVGLLARARFKERVLALRPGIGLVSNVSLVLLLIGSIGRNLPGLLVLGVSGVVAVILLIAAGALAGYLLAVPSKVERRVMALGSGQRNLAAAFVVAEANFASRPEVLTSIATAGVIMILILFPLARWFSQIPPGAHVSRDILRGKAAPSGGR